MTIIYEKLKEGHKDIKIMTLNKNSKASGTIRSFKATKPTFQNHPEKCRGIIVSLTKSACQNLGHTKATSSPLIGNTRRVL